MTFKTSLRRLRVKAKLTRNECIRTCSSHTLGNKGKRVVGEGEKKKTKRCPHSVLTDRSFVFWRVTLGGVTCDL